MNPDGDRVLADRLADAEPLPVWPLRAVAETVSGTTEVVHAFNEIAAARRDAGRAGTGARRREPPYRPPGRRRGPRRHPARLHGVQPLGSRAHPAAGQRRPRAHADLPQLPRRWPGALLPSSATVRLEVEDVVKRPADVVADQRRSVGVRAVEVSARREDVVQLLFDRHAGFSERVLREQFAV